MTIKECRSFYKKGGDAKMRENRLLSLITDCRDDNARARVLTRAAGLLPAMPVATIGVASDLEAGLNLVDQLDASDGQPGIILVNVAPRNGYAKKWENGTPFGWLEVNGTHIFGTVAGQVFSLLQKVLGEKLEVKVFDFIAAIRQLNLPNGKKHYLTSTQFRSFEFLPRLAALVLTGKKLRMAEFAEIPLAPSAIAWVDCFGNVKTSLLPEEAGFASGKTATLHASGKSRKLVCYQRLKDIPDGESGLVIGSSGLWVGDLNRRFLEIMVNGGSAAAHFKLKSGDKIEINLS